MKILLRHTSIDFSHYDAVFLHDTFAVISFRVKSEIEEKCMQLPLVFENGRAAREAYKRILQGRNAGTSSVSLSDFDCIWPMETAQKIEQYAQHMYDFDRPIEV